MGCGLEVEYDANTDVLVVSGAVDGGTAAARIGFGCEHPNGPVARLGWTCDATGHLCRLEITGAQALLDYHRRRSASEGPPRLGVEAVRARVAYAAGEYAPTWDVLYVDLVGERDRGTEWNDLWAECDACLDDGSPFFGLCIDINGRLNGVIIEFPNGVIRVPPDAEKLADDDPRWPN